MADENNNLSFIKIIAIFVVMIIIAAGTSYGVMVYLNTDEEVSSQKPEIGPTYSLGEFTVNLSGTGGYQFIKASIVVETDTEEVINELEKRSPQIRDNIISIMREARINEIEEPGVKIIKNRIITSLNQLLNTGEIDNVWFTKLVVQ